MRPGWTVEECLVMMSDHLRLEIAMLGVFLLLLPAVTRAQTGTASIPGLFRARPGAARRGVPSPATTPATNVTHVAVTNETGNYTITPVTVGSYVVKAELAGFRTSTTA